MVRDIFRNLRMLLFLAISLVSVFCFAEDISSELQASVRQAFVGRQIRSSEEDFERMEAALKYALMKDPHLVKEAPAMAAVIADLYLQNQHIQEAIWALDRGGRYAEAEYLAGHYEEFLQSAEIVKVRALGTGVSRPKLVTFANGLQEIIKPADWKSSVDSEIWTYQFDRLVGLNVVAAAVKRMIGGREYSAHGFVNGARETDIDLKDAGDVRFPDIYLLDFLIKNIDRHEQNSMWTMGKRMFGVDHGQIGVDGVHETFDKKMKPSGWVLHNLSLLPLGPFFTDFCKKFHPRYDMSFVADRIREVRKSAPMQFLLSAGRPHTRVQRLQQSSSSHFQKLDADTEAQLKSWAQKIIERSEVLPATKKISKEAGLTAENMHLWIDSKAAVRDALTHLDFHRFEQLLQQSKAHPELEKIFQQELELAVRELEDRYIDRGARIRNYLSSLKTKALKSQSPLLTCRRAHL